MDTNIIQTIHGHWRWVVALVALAALVKFAIGWFGKGKVTSLDKQLASAYAIVITIQLVLGLINLVIKLTQGIFIGSLYPEHIVYGLVATGLAHAIPMRKDDRPDDRRFRMGTIFVLASLAVVVLSVVRIRGGWSY